MKTIFFIAITTALLSFQFAANAQNWLIAGNSNTTNANFIGTKSAQPLIFKTNNVERMRITKNGQLGIGLINPTASLQITNPTFVRGISITNSFGSSSDHIGIYSSSIISDGFGYGLQAYGGYYGALSVCQGGAFSGSGYGLAASAYGTSGSRYGVYGYAYGGAFNAAGFFDGDV